jgi:uncharacterized membrane protein
MKWKAPLAIAGTFASLTTADVLNLGSLDQYKPKLVSIRQISSHHIEYF